DGTQPPGDAVYRLALLLGEEPATVARALDVRGQRLRGYGEQVAEAVLRHASQPGAPQAQPPGVHVYQRCGGVVAHEEQLVGGDFSVPAQRLPACLRAGAVDDEVLGR